MKSFRLRIFIAIAFWAAVVGVKANVPGGGTGSGANVTLTDNGSTVTIANGIVSIVCTKSGGTINQIYYTYNNGNGPTTTQLLAGGHNGGLLYWENSSSQGLTFNYSLVSDPANNGGNYAEIKLTSTSVPNDELEVHYSLLRGASGFYVTAIYRHRSSDGTFGMGECRDNIYAGSIFNWMSVDGTRNRLMEVSGGSAIGVQGAPKEVSLWTNGIYAGQYEDKYKYSADLGVNHFWGWSSVGVGGKNVGLWNINASSEYYNGGPLKRELMEHIGTTILNMLNGGHYNMGSDGNFASGEVWSKVCGPYFIYCNHVSDTITNASAAAHALYSDALAQQSAEQSAWPYRWFTNADYASASQRGTVTGQIHINDVDNPNASASNLWVGVIQQPSTTDGVYGFQQWMKPYQFWVKTDAAGHFTIPHVIAGTNYTLYAFGPGAAGTFMSQSQTGGVPPITVNLPATPFAVNVTGGTTNHLGTVTWTPTRVGPTVFQIGYPNRTADKFRHGHDYWVGDIGPDPSDPSPIWSKWLEYPFDFPNGVNYVVGQSRWTTDWNFCQPVLKDAQGNYNNSSSTITFNLAAAPQNGATASLYLGLSSDYYAAIIVTVNGNNLGGVRGVSGSPNNSIPTTGYYAGYGHSDTTIREGNNAAFSDERITFPASLLHAGANTITIGIRQVGGSYFADHAMYDYIRLEMTGYVPPAPAGVSAYAGNNGNLVSWPVVPGATSYNVLRSISPNSGFVSITNGVTGPVCGSGPVNATYLDTSAANGGTYYYEVQAVNPAGQSAASLASSGASPASSISISAPATPTGLTVSSVSHHKVSLSWSATPGADCYTLYRSIVVNDGVGDDVKLETITLNNAITGTSYTDTTPTDGSTYQYFVSATSAGGTSGDSAPVTATPLPTAPSVAPTVTSTTVQSTNVMLSWPPVSSAVGYVIQRASRSSGPYILLGSITETNYTDKNLHPGASYYYKVSAMNAAGTATASGILFGPGTTNVTWSGASSSTWNTSVANWLSGGSAVVYVDGDAVQFDDSGATGNIVITNTVYPGSVTFDNTNLNYTVSTTGGGIAGSTSLIKNGPGSLTLSSTNGYVGGTMLNAGTLTFDDPNAAGSGSLALNGGTLVLGSSAIIGNPMIVSGSVSLLPGRVTYNNSMLSGGGVLNISITGNNTYSVSADMSSFAGTIALGSSTGYYRFYGSLGSSAAAFDLGTGSATLLNRNGNVTLQLGSLSGGPNTSLIGASSIAAPTTYIVGGNNLDATFQGAIADNAGTAAIVKTGSGVWTLSGANTYSGGTTVSNGSLLVDNSAGSATGSGAVTVNSGATLGGSGSIAGAVMINSGAMLAPGNPFGTLDCSNSVTLAGGSTTRIGIQPSPLTNSAIIVNGTLNAGGTLVVTNIGSGALMAGDVFHIITATSFGGAFANVILPPLTSGLAWNASTLNSNGDISVVSTSTPVIGGGQLIGGKFVLRASSGTPGQPVCILTTTNLDLPFTNWTRMATNQFDSNGNVAFTNALNPQAAQTFYRLQAP